MRTPVRAFAGGGWGATAKTEGLKLFMHMSVFGDNVRQYTYTDPLLVSSLVVVERSHPHVAVHGEGHSDKMNRKKSEGAA